MGYKGIDIPQIRKNKSDTENVTSMEIKRNGSQPSGKGPADWFTGTARIDPLFQANTPARAFAASVTFEPGARTAWHTHPLDDKSQKQWGRPVNVKPANDGSVLISDDYSGTIYRLAPVAGQ